MYQHIMTYCVEQSKTDKTTFCDNCPGQNRNRFLMKMLSIVLHNTVNTMTIELIFLTKGHTQNENDSVHSCVEAAKKGITVYAPGEWLAVVQST